MAVRSARSLAAEAAFRARLAELGATLLEPEWLGGKHPHRVRCAAGHECSPRPFNVQQGRGVCPTCGHARTGQASSDRAWAEFRARVAELGGTVLEPAWLGRGVPHRVICAAGHECRPWPTSVQQGNGLCATCGYAKTGRMTSERAGAWPRFRSRVAELGGTVLEPTWLGYHVPHRVKCPLGHECRPRPCDVLRSQGLCLACVGRDSSQAWARFRARVAELGGTVLERGWLGSNMPHRVICAAGHECLAYPSSAHRGGLCRTCVGQDSTAAEVWFWARVAELGGTVLERGWLGDGQPHRVRCGARHVTTTIPTNVRSGQGICRWCAGKEWDVFYVVTTDPPDRIKFGISSHGGKARLRGHRAAGYSQVVRLMPNLPDDTAPAIERAVLATLRLADIRPVRGREYYDAGALALVLDIADNYPVPAAA